MLEEIKGESFEEYFKILKDDFYSSLALEGYDKANMSPSFKKVNDIVLMATAKRFWEIKVAIDKIPEMFEAAIPALRGGGYQPNKSDLDDSNPPQDTGATGGKGELMDELKNFIKANPKRKRPMEASKEIDSILEKLQRYDADSQEPDDQGSTCLFADVKASLEILKSNMGFEANIKNIGISIIVKSYKINNDDIVEALTEGIKEALK